MNDADPKKHKYEYEHYVIAPSVHFGRHSKFGRHVAVGEGPDSVHIYPTRLWIGGKEGTALPLNPAQMLIVSRVLNKIEQRSSSYRKLDSNLEG